MQKPAHPFIYFRRADQPEPEGWFVHEMKAEAGNWMLFLRAGAERRRLAPVPIGWQLLGPPGLTALLAAAVPIPWHPQPSVSSGSSLPGESLTEQPDESTQVLWERERRRAAEALLHEAVMTIADLQQELQNANIEMQSLNEELQNLTRIMNRA